MNKKNPLAGLGLVCLSLASPAPQAQYVPPNPQLPPPTSPQVNLGFCYEIVNQNGGVLIDLRATATDPYTITLTWSGLAGVYEINHKGPSPGFNTAVRLGPDPNLITLPPNDAVRRFKPPAAPQAYPGNLLHTPAAPGSQHNYTIIGTLADGRRACGLATTNTPPAPHRETPAHTRPLPPPPVQPAATLTVVTVNYANSFAVSRNITWDVKVDRLAQHITTSGQVPDIISMTESSGWTTCSSPTHDNVAHYDMVDRLIWRLRNSINVTYRVAYLTGQEGQFGFAGRCRYYSGDTVLYNPNKLVNLTPADVANRPQVLHDSTLLGMQVRKSLPICNRAARVNIPNLEQLIDGPPQIDRCNRETPSAPAWAWQERNPDGGFTLTATLARFGLVGVPGSSFDVVTTHPTNLFELLHHAPISNFIAAMTGPPFRTTRPYYPTIVLGDFNCLTGQPPYDCPDRQGPAPPGVHWPVGTTQMFRSPHDVMAVALGNGGGALPPLRNLTMALGAPLPGPEPCRPPQEERDATGQHYFEDRSFSDHCGLLVRFSE
jgi:hypothetical protein